MSADQDRKTLPPSPRRLEEARKRGEVPRSKELVGAAATFIGGLAVVFTVPNTLDKLLGLFRAAFLLEAKEAQWLALTAFFAACWPPLVAAVLAVLVSGVVQLGFPPAWGKLSFKPEKIFGLSGLKEIFSPKTAAWRTLKSLLRFVLVGLAAWLAVRGFTRHFWEAPALEAELIIHLAQQVGHDVILWAGGALFLLGLADYEVARRRMNKQLMMTPEEMKRENKDQEGDPEIRRARKRRMRALAKRRLAIEVPKADVVIVNPTHYAAAIRYQSGKDRAPRLVAKGTDAAALQIRELARKAGVPIVARPPLARLIVKTVAEGREVPAELYQAVAEVLAYVYRIRRRLP